MPSNAMLAVPAKGSAGVLDVQKPIKTYIASEFGSASAEGGTSSLKKAQKLRDSAAEMAGGAEEVKASLLGYQPPGHLIQVIVLVLIQQPVLHMHIRPP